MEITFLTATQEKISSSRGTEQKLQDLRIEI